MPYARADDLYNEIASQVSGGHFDNAKEIAFDALKSAMGEGDDFIGPIADITLNFELSGRFGGERVEILLDVRTSNSLNRAIRLLSMPDIRVVIQGKDTQIRDDVTKHVRLVGRQMFFYHGSSCFLTMNQHYRYNIIGLKCNK